MSCKIGVAVLYISSILDSGFLGTFNPLHNYENSRLCLPKGGAGHLN